MRQIPKFQFLIVDYNRPDCAKIVIDSIRQLVKLDNYWITFLSNGGNQDYVIDLYKNKLINQLVIRDTNLGGSWGMRDLAQLCQSEYCFLIQVDQFLIKEINQNTINSFIDILDAGYKCVDLAGNQCQFKYSDRAQFVKTKDYIDWVSDAKHNGPGWEFGLHNEEHIQNKFKDNNWFIYHFPELYFIDNGKWSIREMPDGSISKHSTDEKKLYWIKKPAIKGSYIPLTDEEWQKSINGEWIDGTIPKAWEKHSFKFWK